MSWVADANATASAKNTICVRFSTGSVFAIPSSAAAMHTCDSSSHARRLPSRAVRKGSGSRSTSGDHKNLKPYASPTQLKCPMVARAMPASDSQNDSVPSTSSSGSPAEKPRNSMPTTRGWV